MVHTSHIDLVNGFLFVEVFIWERIQRTPTTLIFFSNLLLTPLFCKPLTNFVTTFSRRRVMEVVVIELLELNPFLRPFVLGSKHISLLNFAKMAAAWVQKYKGGQAERRIDMLKSEKLHMARSEFKIPMSINYINLKLAPMIKIHTNSFLFFQDSPLSGRKPYAFPKFNHDKLLWICL